MPESCPLCSTPASGLLTRFRDRDYRHCAGCDLVFVPAAQHVPPSAAYSRYRLHRNTPDDQGYRDFLNRLLRELAPLLQPGDRGLDYGSGPGPVLAQMLREQGFATAIYDPFFAPGRTVLKRRYDFITCTETVEHFAQPAAEFDRFNRMLRPGGRLGIMTCIRDPAATLAEWWYIRDETHVAFYSMRTMSWIGNRYGWRTLCPAANVTLFIKPARLTGGRPFSQTRVERNADSSR